MSPGAEDSRASDDDGSTSEANNSHGEIAESYTFPTENQRILLLLDHERNREVLAEWLSDRHFQVLTPESDRTADPTEVEFDLLVVDEPQFRRHRAALAERKANSRPMIRPYLLVHSGSDDLDPRIFEQVDDVLDTPIEKGELRGRIGALLRMRVLSVRLCRQNERLREFASILSHDLRNPLSATEGYLALALEEYDSPHLRKAAQGVERTKRLIEDVLRLVEHGSEAITVECVHLEGAIESAWERTNTEGASLEIDVPPGSELQADEGWLAEAFENLFHNAVEHGGEDVTVRVAIEDDRIVVADDGAGIPGCEREDLFTHSHSTAAGSRGIGLVVVREICEAHGWTVTVSESQSGGARFEICL